MMKKKDKQIEIKKSSLIFDDFIKIEEALIIYQKNNGKMSNVIRRLNIKREDACAILLLDKKVKKILLINQFRYPSYTMGMDFLSEIPAGLKEENETHHDAIIREVLEETGYEIINPKFLFWFFPSAGISSERCFLFFSEIDSSMKRNKGGGLSNENEEIENSWTSICQIKKLINSGKIKDAKTIIALQWFLLSRF